MNKYSVVGKATRNIDGVAKVTGEAIYTFDMTLPGMLYGKLLRSPHPHARIISIDTSEAERLPGVKVVITGKDTPGGKYGPWRRFPELMDEEVLATTKIRFIGDAVAAVAATHEDIAKKALELIKVKYELLPAVFNPVEAAKDDAPQIHDGVENNINVTRHIEWGDVDEAFKIADYVREDRYELTSQSHVPLEVHDALASFDKSTGRLTVWTSTQSPYYVQLGLADALKMREGDIRVIKPHVGGAFGGKISTYPEQICAALLSIKTGKPVKIVLNREEEFAVTRRRTPMYVATKIGAKKDGTIVAKEVKVISDGGAYTALGSTALYLMGTYSSFPYKIPNYRFDGCRVYTNNNPSSAMRGFGGPQAVYISETQIDRLAHDIGIDPIVIRRKNGMTPHYVVPGQATIESCGLHECIDKVEQKVKKWGKLPKYQGVGMVCYGFMCGGIFNWINTPYAFSGAMVRVNVDGTVDLFIQASDIGQGSNTALAMICAEELGISLMDIRLHVADTGITPVDLGAWGSRQTFMTGNAVKAAAAEIKRKLMDVARIKLGENIVYDLEAKNGRIYLTLRPERGYSYYNIVKDAIRYNDGEPLIGTGHYIPHGKGMVSPAFTFGAQAVKVEVDIETGRVKLLDIVTAHDCGQVINPPAVRGQVEGATHMAAGYGLTEELLSEDGLVLNASLAYYKILRYRDMPHITTLEVHTHEPEGPFGAKEAGEGLTTPTAAAIANAVYHAVGVEINSNPLTAERVFKALKALKKNKAT